MTASNTRTTARRHNVQASLATLLMGLLIIAVMKTNVFTGTGIVVAIVTGVVAAAFVAVLTYLAMQKKVLATVLGYAVAVAAAGLLYFNRHEVFRAHVGWSAAFVVAIVAVAYFAGHDFGYRAHRVVSARQEPAQHSEFDVSRTTV